MASGSPGPQRTDTGRHKVSPVTSADRPALSVLDASAAIVLSATGSIDAILRAWHRPVGMVAQTLDEVLFLRDRDTLETEGTKAPISFEHLLEGGLIQLLTIESDAEHAAFLRISGLLDDGEAAAAAVAIARGHELVIDERKAHFVLKERVHLRWSLELVHHWIGVANLDLDQTRAALTRIRLRGAYAPHRVHPLREWWDLFGPAI